MIRCKDGVLGLLSDLSFGYWGNVDETATVATFREEHGAINQGIDGMVLAHAHVEAGVMNRATLTLDDVARFGELAAKNLNSQTFAF